MQKSSSEEMRAEQRGASYVPICAIGASAGGVEALQRLFEALKPDLGLAYVVIVHLAPDHPSALAEILAAKTSMPVRQVVDSPRLERNHVYVIPPDRELVITGDDVESRPFTEPRGRRAPIDLFFRSVAEARGDSMTVVLSGAGSDGAVGVRKIKEAGGVIFVQEPAEAEYPMMPRSAIATGVADFVAPIETIAERIAEVAGAKARLRELDHEEADAQFRQIMAFLRARAGHDFSSYKRATVMRRITRRMQVCRSENLAAYAEYLRQNPEEAHELFGDLLISVTQFFRDEGAFKTLREEAIDALFDELDGKDSIRAWVVGCATGEEAYSLAMLLLEESTNRKVRPSIQVFATDLDEGALGTAREGRYPKSIEADVSEERLRRWFQEEGAHYRIRKEVRDVVLFATHSAVKDPPFTRIDLLSCRNLLIYLERSLQKQLLNLFHYALQPGGYLFLGTAESVDPTPELFAPVDREARVYCAKPRGQGDHWTPENLPPSHQPHLPPPRSRSRREEPKSRLAVHLGALEENAPPSALVDEDHRIVHLSGNAGRFLLPPGGPMSDDLPAIVRPELSGDLLTALHRAFERRTPTLTAPAPVAFDGARRRVAMQVTPVPHPPEKAPQTVVFFLDAGPSEPAELEERPEAVDSGELRRLREELRGAQERLSESRRRHESSTQELRIANEELQSINEEYRSTSEELETSREELQSINEELQTVNAELKSKLDNIASAHSDLENLVAAIELGVLFLDTKLRIKMFTPTVAELFNVTESDLGRPLSDFTHRLSYPHVGRDAAQVLHDLKPLEVEIETHDRRSLLMRLRPYRTLDNRIDGVVASFVDVTELRRAYVALRQTETRLNALVRSTSYAVYRMSPDWTEMQELRGRSFVSDAGKPIRNWPEKYILPDDRPMVWRAIEDAIREKCVFELEHRVRRDDGSIGWTLSRAVPILDDEGGVVEWFGAASDVTARFREKEALAEAQELLTMATSAARLGWGAWDFATGEARWDARGREIIGLGEEENRVKDWLDRVHPEDLPAVEAHIAQCQRTGAAFDFEYRVLHRDGTSRRVHGTGMFKTDGGDLPVFCTGLVRDVTERRRAEAERELLVRELDHRVKNVLAVVQSIARQTRRTAQDPDEFSMSFERRLGALASAHELLTRARWTGSTLPELAEKLVTTFAGADLSRVRVEGPKIGLAPTATVSLAMALHELGTNAVKYGALSTPEGQVTLVWRIEDGPAGGLVIRWEEHGGPKVLAPSRKGFGTRLLEQGVGRDLDGQTRIEFRETGLVCEMRFPFGEAIRRPE